MIIIISLFFIVLIAFAIIMTLKQLKKTDLSSGDTSVRDDIQTAQEFLPFEDIKDGVINLGGFDYRVVIECSSTNYNLKTEKEREIIEISFQRFLNSLTFPITFYIQTKLMDNSKVLEKLEKDLESSVGMYPQLEEYGSVYLREMENLDYHMKNNKQKKKYIIVPYNEGATLNNLTDEEKHNYSVGEAKQRAFVLMDGLNSVGIKTNLLDTKGLSELIYSTYHKDNFSNYEDVVNGEFLTLLVSGPNPQQQLTNEKRLDAILHETQMRIRNELTEKQISEESKKEFEKVTLLIDKIREKTGGYYKPED